MLSVNVKKSKNPNIPVWTTVFPSASSFAFVPHTGAVFGAQFSPFHRNIFITCSTDGSVRIYNSLNPSPLYYFTPNPTSMNYLYQVAWSPGRPLVFACSDAEGYIYVYDLVHSREKPFLVQKHAPAGTSTSNSSSSSASGYIASAAVSSSSTASSSSASASIKSPVVALSFNPKDPSVLVSADIAGRICMWQLSPQLSVLQNGEINAIDKMGSMV
jgi:WD40 repeat protein